MSVKKMAKELIEIKKQRELLEKKEELIRNDLLGLMKNNQAIEIENFIIKKEVHEVAITDEDILKKYGIYEEVIELKPKVNTKKIKEISEERNLRQLITIKPVIKIYNLEKAEKIDNGVKKVVKLKTNGR